MTAIAPPIAGFKWPVAVRTMIWAPSARVWEVISEPGALEFFHPFCRRNPVHLWPGPDAHDEVHYFNGLLLVRRFFQWHEGRGYDLRIGTTGGRTSVVSWRIDSVGRHRSSIEITIYPHAVQHLPVAVRWLPHLARLRPQLRRYLQSVVMGLKWHIDHGQPVQRNQFGGHPWFSPPAGPGNGTEH